ncbi:MAG: hypothetical protein R2769_17380 [Saprospiraceae bacterium]
MKKGVQIDANGSSSGANFNLSWIDPNGNLLNPTDPLNPDVTDAGTYRLIIENNQNACKDSLDIVVVADHVSPWLQLQIHQT